jgi:hypothetical protein
MEGVERLSLVAKFLMDMRLLELKRENEELKIKLFWKDHSPSMLKQAMAVANMVEGGPRCACLACIVGGRCADGTRGFAPYPFVDVYNEHHVLSQCDRCHLRCQFKPWFENKIREAGMSVRVDALRDDGQHFSNLGSADWNTFVYGSRLWKASSVADLELGKLRRLFHALTLPDLDEFGLPLAPRAVLYVDEFGLPFAHDVVPLA